jgi:signal peptidase II
VVAAGAAADLVSKAVVFERLAESAHRSCTVVPRVLRFTLSTNPGIVFGLPVPGWLVLVATLAAAVTVVALFATSSRRRWGLHLALAMVLAGSLGNAYDRLFSRVHFAGEPLPRTHQVRDFIDFHVINYPVFNVADVLLVVGVLLILLQLHRQRRRLGPL